jgi:peptidyl-prolyl cis-trans isomerase C
MKFALFAILMTSTSYAAELAKVGDATITTESYGSALKALGQQGEMVSANPELKKRFLDHIVNSKLVSQEALKAGFDKDPKFQARLADMTQQLLAGEYMDYKLDKDLTDDAVKKYYEEHKGDFSKKEIRASHILVDSEELAKKLLAEVKKPGADFEAIGKKNSKDKSVDLGFFGHGRMVPEFDKAAFATAKGSIHPVPVHTSFGWHIIKVVDVKGEDKVDYATVKDEVKKRARQVMQEDLVHSLRAKTKVVVNEQQLKDFKLP